MKKKILILEDEKEIARLYAKRLEDKGHDPRLAFDGLEGLEILKNFKPDLILLDVNMPKMGGLEFYQHICDPQGKPKYPVLVLTGRADLEKLFKDFHVEGVLIKPFAQSRLSQEVDIILDKSYWEKTDGSAKKVIIVDDDQVAVKNILAVFAKAGFNTDSADSGVSGIEKIMAAPPDLALVKLGLTDIAGDLVILRLQQIARTRMTSTILYVPKDKEFELDIFVMEQIAHKRGVTQLLEYGDPVELLNAAIGVFKKLEQEA
jgi:DNA-binding response OmpR family regulator